MNTMVILFLTFAVGAFAQMAKVVPENADKEAIQQGTGQILGNLRTNLANTICIV